MFAAVICSPGITVSGLPLKTVISHCGLSSVTFIPFTPMPLPARIGAGGSGLMVKMLIPNVWSKPLNLSCVTVFG